MLEINKLQKKYENFELNCSMKVEKGYITALVGENGAGKEDVANPKYSNNRKGERNESG